MSTLVHMSLSSPASAGSNSTLHGAEASVRDLTPSSMNGVCTFFSCDLSRLPQSSIYLSQHDIQYSGMEYSKYLALGLIFREIDLDRRSFFWVTKDDVPVSGSRIAPSGGDGSMSSVPSGKNTSLMVHPRNRPAGSTGSSF